MTALSFLIENCTCSLRLCSLGKNSGFSTELRVVYTQQKGSREFRLPKFVIWWGNIIRFTSTHVVGNVDGYFAKLWKPNYQFNIILDSYFFKVIFEANSELLFPNFRYGVRKFWFSRIKVIFPSFLVAFSLNLLQ